MSDEGLEELLASLAAFEACDHEWRESRPEEGDPPGTKVCDKCGGGMIPVTAEEYEHVKELLGGTEEEDS